MLLVFLSFLPPILSLRTPAGQSGSETWRAAFENVGDVSLESGDVYFGEQLVEEKTCGTDKGLSLKIFVFSRCLPNDHQPRRSVTDPEDHICPRLR